MRGYDDFGFYDHLGIMTKMVWSQGGIGLVMGERGAREPAPPNHNWSSPKFWDKIGPSIRDLFLGNSLFNLWVGPPQSEIELLLHFGPPNQKS